MELYIPVESVKTYNGSTDKSFELTTSSEEQLKCDDHIVIDDKMLLQAFEEELDNQSVERSFVKKLLKLIASDEDLQNEIISQGLDLATKGVEDPEKTVFLGAKKLWAAIDRGW